MHNALLEIGINFGCSFLIPLFVTTLGVLLAFRLQYLLEKNNKRKRNEDVLETLRQEFKKNIKIANLIIDRTEEGDIRPHNYSANAWDALIGSGILFEYKLDGISKSDISNIYTTITYGNFVENIITDIYLENNVRVIRPERLQYILKKRQGHANKIIERIGNTKLIDMSDDNESTIL